MKKLLLTILSITFCISLYAQICQQPERVSPDIFYLAPCDNGDYTITDYDTYCKDLYDCGFNVSCRLDKSIINIPLKYHLKASVNVSDYVDNSIKDPKIKYEKLAKELNNSFTKEEKDNIFCICSNACDEPKLKNVDNVALYAKTIKSVGFRPYINLNPNYAAKSGIGDDYKEYCNSFVQKCGLDYISYDNYSLDIDDGLQEDRFYSNLEDISSVADANNVRFFNIILAIGHFNLMLPSDYTIEVQAWSTIAYGGKGIKYYDFIQPPFGNYYGGAYDGFGYKTPTWDIIRRMNLQIHSIAPVLSKLKHINTFHYGNVPKGCKDFSSSKLLKAFEVQTKVGVGNCVVGEFVDENNKGYIIVVNKDPKYPEFVCMPQFKNGKKCILVSEYSQPYKWAKNMQENTYGGENQWLSPGHGVIIRSE